jgi:hypothetical protein
VGGGVLGVSMRITGEKLPPLSKLKAGHYVAFKFKPSQIRMIIYSKPDPNDFTELFETIESYDLAT